MPQTKEQRVAYYWKNKERINAYSAAYHATHREEINERHRIARETEPEKYKDVLRRSRKKHKERVSEYARSYRIKNQEKLSENDRNYKEKHPYKNRMKAHKRRTLVKNAFKEVVDPRIIFERDGWICKLCKEPVDKNTKHPDRGCAVVDHIQPLAIGGIHAYSNVQLAHHGCNLMKGVRF
jgi:hypothetical protein